MRGAPRGGEFRVNSETAGAQYRPAVASDAAGNFVVAWVGPDGGLYGVFAQRFDAAGVPRGGEFRVNEQTSSAQLEPAVAGDATGGFVVAWRGPDGDGDGIFARRFDAMKAPRGAEFRVNTYTTGAQRLPAVASDATGNLLVVWESVGQDGSVSGVFGQRFGGLVPHAASVDTTASASSDGNGILEPGESVDVRPAWRNVADGARSFDGTLAALSGPAAPGVSYVAIDSAASYGTVPAGAVGPCADCYEIAVTFAGTRPALHWDATLTEGLTPDALGQVERWPVHVAASFQDVAATSPYYRFVETLLHRGVTAGCGGASYCPASSTTREQMAAFVLLAKEGPGYAPRPCTSPGVFADVPPSSPFCDVIEELVRRNVAGGCGGGNYCPSAPVTREQMGVFLAVTYGLTLYGL